MAPFDITVDFHIAKGVQIHFQDLNGMQTSYSISFVFAAFVCVFIILSLAARLCILPT